MPCAVILQLIGLICMMLGCSVCLSSVKWNIEFLNSNCVLNLLAAATSQSSAQLHSRPFTECKHIINLDWNITRSDVWACWEDGERDIAHNLSVAACCPLNTVKTSTLLPSFHRSFCGIYSEIQHLTMTHRFQTEVLKASAFVIPPSERTTRRSRFYQLTGQLSPKSSLWLS